MVKLDIDLPKLVNSLKNYKGITRKRPIEDVVKSFPVMDKLGAGIQVLADFGEDAAVISLSGDAQDSGVLLLAADGIMASLLDTDPYWAGYCSVLVNLHDIAAMGGVPLALVDILSIKDEKVLSELTSGMTEASKKFGVPIVGGHIHPDSEYNAVDVAVLGITRGSSVIYSNSAEVGDKVIIAMDLDGRIHPNSKYSWDTTLHKTAAEVRRQLSVMPELGMANLVHAGKDISNPGTLGTLGMLLETSKKGAIVDLAEIPWPEKNTIEFSHWLKMYQGCGFVVTCEPKLTYSVIDRFSSVGLAAKVAGEVLKDLKLSIELENDKEILFDFTKEKISGI